MLLHRGSSTTTPNRTIYALSLAPSSAPWGASESAPKGGHSTRTARRPVRSKRPAGYARSCPARCAGPCPGRLSSRTRAAVWRATAQAAPSAGTRKPARGATDGDTRWRRDQIHFSPAGTAPTGAEARPEWSVASDAEGGTRRAVRAVRTTPVSRWRSLAHQQYLGGIERGRTLDVPRRRKYRRNEARSESRPASVRGLSW
jgi:hypothetical protein